MSTDPGKDLHEHEPASDDRRPLTGRRRSAPAYVLIAAVQVYRHAISPWLPPSCRFEPSCSSYALEAVRVHGAVRGGWLAVRRIARCHPWHAGGLDPVPAPGAARHPSSRRAVTSGATRC